ncbi:MAG: hypothetical protein PHD32_08105 [Eubacteriales bacterium]|nr:hypothetical protein [Eubacteriales bacterium]
MLQGIADPTLWLTALCLAVLFGGIILVEALLARCLRRLRRAKAEKNTQK